MSGSGRKPPLVAERRHSAKRAAQPAKRKPASRKPAARKVRRGNFVTRFFGGIFRLVFRMIWGVTWRLAAVVALLLAFGTFYYYSALPPVNALLDARTRGSVTLLDRDGRVFAWRGETFGGQITVANVSPHLKHAVIATEDRRFYSHLGVSVRGVASAIRINMREGRGPFSGNGGSTITQQVAKLLCLGVPFDPSEGQTEAQYEAECRETSLWRKIKEVPYALAMETKYSKDEILTIYLNRAYLGAGARGFEAAAQRYFGKSANQVEPAEAAMLAGLLVAPSYYAPTRSLERAQGRANVIVGLMAEQGYLSNAQLAEARANPAQLSEAAEARAGGYFADWVMESGPSFLTSETTEDVVIRTTLDPRIQRAAEAGLQHIFDTKVREGSEAQAAVVIMSSDGAVRAIVGGRRTQVSGAFNRATQALRQTGSSFKPFVFAAAMDLGYNPSDWVEDSPYTIDIPGSGPWSPRNFTRDFVGPMTLLDAFKQSRNVPAVRVSESVGRDNVRRVASEFGIASSMAQGPALALGTSESTLMEMTGAYAGLLNGGNAVRPYGIMELRLAQDNQPLMGKDGGLQQRVISESAAALTTYMMREAVNSGTGTRARLAGGREAAGKTGTTSAARDAWFIGFTADYVGGVWMGYDDNTPLNGVTGGGLPAEIWKDVMDRVHEGLPQQPLPVEVPPPPVPLEVVVQQHSGQAAGTQYHNPQYQQPQYQEPQYQEPQYQEPVNPVDQALRELLGAIVNGN